MSLSDSSPGGGCVFSRLQQVGTADFDPGRPGLQEITPSTPQPRVVGCLSAVSASLCERPVFSPAVVDVSY